MHVTTADTATLSGSSSWFLLFCCDILCVCVCCLYLSCQRIKFMKLMQSVIFVVCAGAFAGVAILITMLFVYKQIRQYILTQRYHAIKHENPIAALKIIETIWNENPSNKAAGAEFGVLSSQIENMRRNKRRRQTRRLYG